MRGGKGKHGLLPSSLRIISSCLKTVSSHAATTVRSAGASVAASIAVPAEDAKDKVLWAGFDKLQLGPDSFKNVLLLGYSNGFQIVDVEDASNVCELVSKRDGPVTFLQMQPIPSKSEESEGFRASEESEGFRASHPLLLVVAGDETDGSGMVQGGRLSAFVKESTSEPQLGDGICAPTAVQIYSLKSHSYVHVLRFRSAVYIVRCSRRVVAVALAAQIYCFDAVTFVNKFSVLTYPFQGAAGVNIGYGPMAVGPRWLAYSPNIPLMSNTGRLSPQNLTPSPGVSPSTSPGSGSLVARYAMESSKQLASGILNLGDMGYKTLSKYCHEFLPDGSSSPLSSNSGRRVGKVPLSIHQSDAENSGVVVVKDFITKDVISQFRAHTSPISALCFDPSGTLLVTASVQGHNMNVFRIMPVAFPSGSSATQNDWTSSHVHIYQLYRGITTAVIQDICFSNYSQWIAIVSSRGTCHIFTLSPFGGDSSLQPQSSHGHEPILSPIISLPQWMDQRLPPPPVTLSVVSRIKSGWGKIPTPSGAIAAVFHNSAHHDSLTAHWKANSLEHLLVYSPSGHVIQHELQPSSCAESSDSGSRSGSGPDEELHVKAEPVQWWDVCRRANRIEREQSLSSVRYHNCQSTEILMDTSDCEDGSNSLSGKELAKPHEKHNWYLSNAEVQVNSWRIPIWQKSKICFYVMTPMWVADGRPAEECASGEIRIEKFPVHEVEIRRKDLMPVFEQFHCYQADQTDRALDVGPYLASSTTESNKARGEVIKDAATRHSKPVSPTIMPRIYPIVDSAAFHSESSKSNSPMGECVLNGLSSSSPSSSPHASRLAIADTHSSESASSGVSDACIVACNSPEQAETADSHNSVEFPRYFHEGYCKVSEELDGCRGLTDAVTDADSSSSLCEGGKPEEDDEDNDDMLGSVFAFSEEG